MVERPMVAENGSGQSTRWPVSVKGIIRWGDRFVVLRNERGEWELPGGRLEMSDPDPPAALAREIDEELGLAVDVGHLVNAWMYDVADKRVLILTYVCRADEPGELWHSDEHSGVAAQTVAELGESAIPAGYLESIRLSRGLG